MYYLHISESPKIKKAVSAESYEEIARKAFDLVGHGAEMAFYRYHLPKSMHPAECCVPADLGDLDPDILLITGHTLRVRDGSIECWISYFWED
jgi:hypothetical protein